MESQRLPGIAGGVIVAAVGLVAAGMGCATATQQVPAVPIGGIAHLRDLMDEHRVPVKSYVAEARLTFFGPRGRARGTASLAVQRPRSFRYELQGPHGGVLSAFASNGVELQLSDMKANRFLYGPATPENIDQLLGIAPLGMGPTAWVALLFGEVSIPEAARVVPAKDADVVRVAWQHQGQLHEIDVETNTFRVRRILVRDDTAVVSEIVVAERDPTGLARRLEARVPAMDTQVEIRLRDVDFDVQLDPRVFVLDPPRGVTPEHLGQP